MHQQILHSVSFFFKKYKQHLEMVHFQNSKISNNSEIFKNNVLNKLPLKIIYLRGNHLIYSKYKKQGQTPDSL